MSSTIAFQALTHALYLDAWYSGKTDKDTTGIAPLPGHFKSLPKVTLFFNRWKVHPFKAHWPEKLVSILCAADRLPFYASEKSALAKTHQIELPLAIHERTSVVVRTDELRDCLIGLRLPLPARLFPESELNTDHASKQDDEGFDSWYSRRAEITKLESRMEGYERDLASGKYTDRLALEGAIEELTQQLERTKAEGTPSVPPLEQATTPIPRTQKPTFWSCFPRGDKGRGGWWDILRDVIQDYIKSEGRCPCEGMEGAKAVYALISQKAKDPDLKITPGTHKGESCFILGGDQKHPLTKKLIEKRLRQARRERDAAPGVRPLSPGPRRL